MEEIMRRAEDPTLQDAFASCFLAIVACSDKEVLIIASPLPPLPTSQSDEVSTVYFFNEPK